MTSNAFFTVGLLYNLLDLFAIFLNVPIANSMVTLNLTVVANLDALNVQVIIVPKTVSKKFHRKMLNACFAVVTILLTTRAAQSTRK